MVVMGLILLVCKQVMLFQCDFSVLITLPCPGFVHACLCKRASLCFGTLKPKCACLPPTIAMSLRFNIRVFVQYKEFCPCLPPEEGGNATINDSGSLKCV